MSKQPKAITVTLEKTKRKSQPWTFVIDKPGSKQKETKREYYARQWTAKRGALRQLDAMQYGSTFNGEDLWVIAVDKKPVPIKFVVIDHTASRVTIKLPKK